ncbi:MAG: outer membrane beta-barrel protein [Litorimonas sp.]
MKKVLLLSAVSAFGIMTSSSIANANDDDGWYLRGNAGYGIHTESGITGDVLSGVHDGGVQSEGDPAYSVGAGYDFGNNFRVELDGDYLQTDLGSLGQLPASSAKLRTTSVMLNALYDFDGLGRFEPFIGAGVGLVSTNAKLVAHDFATAGQFVQSDACVGTRTAATANQGLSCSIDDFDRGIGFQLLAGLGYELTDNLTWDTHYTYLQGPDVEVRGVQTNGVTGAQTAIDAVVERAGAHTLVTGLRYKFGHSHTPEPVAFTPPPTPPKPTFTCWDNTIVETSSQCAAKPVPTQTCWDGSVINATATCSTPPPPPPTYTCWDNSVVYDLATCPTQVVEQRANLNLCAESPVAIFNVPVNATPKQLPRLGTLPEFGDSHSLTPSQFYEKLDARYKDNATDKAYLNYLFKSMGYSNGWADAQAYMFSEEVLPVGTRGLLGLGKQHHYNYSILPTNQRDREAFRIQSANGSVVHFMKTCGNYMYACE